MKLSKGIFLGTIGVSLGLSPVLLIYFAIQSYGGHYTGLTYSMLILGILLQVTGVTMASILLYRLWKAIHDGFPRTTPQKAAGFLFIPFYNLYWAFQAIWGYSKDFNRYTDLWVLNVPKLPEYLFLTLTVFMVATWLLFWIPVIGQIFYIVQYILLMRIIPLAIDTSNAAMKQKAETPTYYR